MLKRSVTQEDIVSEKVESCIRTAPSFSLFEGDFSTELYSERIATSDDFKFVKAEENHNVLRLSDFIDTHEQAKLPPKYSLLDCNKIEFDAKFKYASSTEETVEKTAKDIVSEFRSDEERCKRLAIINNDEISRKAKEVNEILSSRK